MTVCKPCPHFPGYYNGFQYSDVTCTICRYEARIRELEAALREIADFSEQFIGDDEDGDERMYKVNQIADTALACQPS